MGREIRRVPPNWEHPRYTEESAPYRNRVGEYHPMRNRPFRPTFAEWLADFDRVRSGELTESERECYPTGLAEWLRDEGLPPDPAYYRPDWADGEATWFQVYETVSEGTPVTPPFATKSELIDYLATHGDFWDQRRRAEGRGVMECGPWGRDAASKFVEDEWAPSMMVMATPAGVSIKEPRDGM